MNKRNFVAPLPPVERRESATFDVSPYMGGDVIQVGQPLAANHGATEKTSGMDRSLAWVVRMAPYTLIILILSITLVSLAGGGWVLAFCLFASSSLVVYLIMDGREHKYSRNGLERHKVDTLAQLKFNEQDNAFALESKKLDFLIERERGRENDYREAARATITTTHRRIESRD